MKSSGRRQIKTLSIFSGAGGLDIGFHQAGFDIAACVELSEDYCKTLEANRGLGKTFPSSLQVICDDIRNFDPSRLAIGQIDCIIGGPPCQTFSAAGRRSGGVLGTTDARGRLFSEYCRIIATVRPELFVFENVYGLPGASGGGPWREITAAFSELGYQLEASVLDAADYGVPQHRERLILVGYRSGTFSFPAPTHGPDSSNNQPFMSAGAAISDIRVREKHTELGGLYGHLLPGIPPGLNYSFYTREMGHPTPIFAWRSKFHDFLYKADPSTPCRTIKAQPGKFTGPFHWNNRHFSVRELKRLQSFPDDYDIVGTQGKVMEQIGNSVPPRLANVIAVSIRDQLIDKQTTLTYATRPALFLSTFRQRQRDRTYHFKAVAKEAININAAQATVPPLQNISKRESVYYATYSSFFEKHLYKSNPRKSHGVFKIKTLRKGKTLQITVACLNGAKMRPVTIHIDGLQKCLGEIDSVEATADLPKQSDIFAFWDIIQDALVANSQFFTLIDIYGHYANRGDTVKVCTKIKHPMPRLMRNALEFFGDSKHCGVPIAENALRLHWGLSQFELNALIAELRELRFDMRSRKTHATMQRGKILCTYPFPLLSGKAHLSRKATEEMPGISGYDLEPMSLFA